MASSSVAKRMAMSTPSDGCRSTRLVDQSWLTFALFTGGLSLRSEQRMFEQAQQELDSALGWDWSGLDDRDGTGGNTLCLQQASYRRVHSFHVFRVA